MYEIIHVNNPHSVDRYNAHVHNKPAMVLFYMDGCGHCEMMKPEWKAFEDEYTEKTHNNHRDVLIAKINQKYINMIEGHSAVNGFPTIVHLDNGKKVSEFREERTLENFKKFMRTLEISDKKDKMVKKTKGGSRVKRKKSVSKKRNTRRHKNKTNKQRRHKNKTNKQRTKHNRLSRK